ncbi:MAG: hypothetical protein AAB776_01635 [Patescibacteria group bacterium]
MPLFPEVVKCGNCRTRNLATARACSSCGQFLKIDEDGAVTPELPPKIPRQRKKKSERDFVASRDR